MFFALSGNAKALNAKNLFIAQTFESIVEWIGGGCAGQAGLHWRGRVGRPAQNPFAGVRPQQADKGANWCGQTERVGKEPGIKPNNSFVSSKTSGGSNAPTEGRHSAQFLPAANVGFATSALGQCFCARLWAIECSFPTDQCRNCGQMGRNEFLFLQTLLAVSALLVFCVCAMLFMLLRCCKRSSHPSPLFHQMICRRQELISKSDLEYMVDSQVASAGPRPYNVELITRKAAQAAQIASRRMAEPLEECTMR